MSTSCYLFIGPAFQNVGTSPTVLWQNGGAVGGLRNLTVFTTIARTNAQYFTLSIMSSCDFELWGFVPSNTTSLEIRNVRGAPLLSVPFSETTSSPIISMFAGIPYVLSFFNATSGFTANAAVLTLTAKDIRTVYAYFLEGFENSLKPLPSSINITKGQYGEQIYTFSSFQTQENQLIYLCFGSFAQLAGFLVITSSDNSVFQSSLEPFEINNSVAIVLRAKKTVSFSGVVQISIQNVGVLVDTSLEAITIRPYEEELVSLKSLKRKQLTE